MRLCDWCADCNNHPSGKSAPRQTRQRPATPRGIPWRPPPCPFGPSGPSGPLASATPPPPARHRCHHITCIPLRHICPLRLTPPRHRNPTGYHMACHGVARQGEDGRTHLVRQVRQVRQVRHKRHAPAPRIPPLPSNRQAYPTGTFAPEPNQTAPRNPPGLMCTPKVGHN